MQVSKVSSLQAHRRLLKRGYQVVQNKATKLQVPKPCLLRNGCPQRGSAKIRSPTYRIHNRGLQDFPSNMGLKHKITQEQWFQRQWQQFMKQSVTPFLAVGDPRWAFGFLWIGFLWRCWGQFVNKGKAMPERSIMWSITHLLSFGHHRVERLSPLLMCFLVLRSWSPRFCLAGQLRSFLVDQARWLKTQSGTVFRMPSFEC